MKKTRAQINQTERLYWNESKLKRAKIKPLRRHAFHYSYKKEELLLKELLSTVEGKNILELGSNTWTNWINNKHKPKKGNDAVATTEGKVVSCVRRTKH